MTSSKSYADEYPATEAAAGPGVRVLKATGRGDALLVQRAGNVIEVLGGVTRVAHLLGVSKSQPSRWRTGAETPSPEKARELVDLDHVVARAQLLWADREVVEEWLTGPNAYLGGATPIDVIRLRGASEVINALDEAMSGAYA